MAQSTSRTFLRSMIGGVAAFATVASMLVTAVVAAPAAQASTGVTRLQLQNVNSNIDVTNPSPGSTYKRHADARRSTLPLTVTFAGGTASFTVDGGTATPLTSDVSADVPIHSGITSIVVAFNDGNATSTYTIEVKRAWPIDGYEVYDSVTGDLLVRRHIDDNNFDPLSFTPGRVTVPHATTGVRWKVFYTAPTEPTAAQRSIWIHGGTDCGGYDCASGELSNVQALSVGTWAGGGPGTQVDGGSGFDYFTFTTWEVQVTRLSAYADAALTNVAVNGVNLTPVNDASYTFRGVVSAERSTVPLTASFPAGSATYSVNGGNALPLTSGTAVTIPVSIGVNPVTITHTAPGGTQTVYTYRLVRPMPITGFEVADAVTGEVLFSRTGNAFDVSVPQYYLTVPSASGSLKMRMFYDTPPDGYVVSSWFHGLENCDGICESGEWSRPFTLWEGQTRSGGPLSMCGSPGCIYGDWTIWTIDITRAWTAVVLSSVSVSGTAAVGEGLRANLSGLNAVPAATAYYQWQYADSANGPWTNIAGATSRSYVVRRSVTGKVLRAEVTASNGISTPAVVASAPTAVVASAPLAAPTNVTVIPGDRTLEVRWTPPADPDYVDSTVTAVGGGATRTCTGETSCTISALTNGVTYSVTAVARAGTGAGEVTSSASSAVNAVPAVPTAPGMNDVAVQGTANVGERLRAVPGGLTGTPGPTVTYVWERSDNGSTGWTVIPRATRASLLVGEASVGKYIRVRATASTGVNPNVTRTSAVVGPVADVTDVLPDSVLNVAVPGAETRPRDVAFDSQGNMYVITGWNTGNDSIVKYAPDATGDDAPLAVWNRGDDGSALWGSGIAVDSQDNVWIADHNWRLWKLPAGASAAERPQLKMDNPAAARPFGITVDRSDYIYVTTGGQVRVFSPAVTVGDAPLRIIEIGADTRDLAIAEDGSLMVAAGNDLKFYAPGPTGTSTPVRSIISTDYCRAFYGIAVDADGRIYNNHHHCRKTYVYNPNAVDTVAPIRVLDSRNDYGQMGTNPVTGDVYLAGYDRKEIMGWERSGLALGPIPTPGVPRMNTVTTSLTGELAVRGSLSGSYSDLTGLPAPTLRLQWEIADSAAGPWSPIAGATGAGLDLTTAMQGKHVRFSVTVTNSYGSTTTSSTARGPIAPRPDRGVDRFISGSSVLADNVIDIEFLPGDRIAAVSQWARPDRIPVFGPTADGAAEPDNSITLPSLGNGNSGWGVTAAQDGSIWAALYHYGVVKVPSNANGETTPTRVLTNSLRQANGLVEDANGYLYVGQPDFNTVKVFAPGAGSGAEPIRVINVWSGGLGIDIEGNLVVASNSGVLRFYEPGASTNNDPIKEVPIGYNWERGEDLGIDSQKRIWVLVGGRVKVFNPKVQSTSVPVLEVTDDWATRLGGVSGIAVSKETNGVWAISTTNSIRTYDYSRILPAVPAEASPVVGSVTVSGTVAFGETLTASVSGLVAYPDARITYQWQRASSSTGPWTDIANATGSTYVPARSDASALLRVVATATNSAGATSKESAPTTRLGFASVKTPNSSIAGLRQSWAMHLLPSGNLLVANRGDVVREFAGGASFNPVPVRVITANGFSGPAGVFQDASGYLWINYEGQNRVVKLAGDAGRNATPLQVLNPQCGMHAKVVVDAQGFIYVPCWADGVVKVFAPDATGDAAPLRTITNVPNARPMLDPNGTLTVVGSNYVRTYALGGASASTAPITDKAAPFHLMDVTWDDRGNIILAGWWNGVRAYPLSSAQYNGGDFVADGLQMIRESWSVAYDSTNDQLIVGNYHGDVTVYDWAAVLQGDPVAPSRPTGLQVTAGDGVITGTWTPPSETYTSVEMYADGGGRTLSCVAVAPSRTCSITAADGLVNGTHYFVYARAYNQSSASSNSDGQHVLPRDSEPAQLNAVSLDGSPEAGRLVRSSLDGLSGFPAPTVTYRWQVSNDGQDGWTNISGATTSSLFLGDSLIGKHVRLRARAITTVGSAVVRDSASLGPISVAPTGAPVNLQAGSGPVDVAFDAQGHLWVANADRDGVPGSLEKFAPGSTASDAPLEAWRGSFSGGVSAVTVASDGSVWFATWSGRVMTLPAGATSETLPTEIVPATNRMTTGIAVDANGLVYTTLDGSPGEVRVYQPDGTRVRTITGLDYPRAVRIAPSGELLILTHSRLYAAEAGANGSNALMERVTEDVCNFTDFALDADGRIFISRGWCGGLPVFKANVVERVQALFTIDPGPAQLSDHRGLAMAPDGRTMYVASWGNKLIVSLDTSRYTYPAADPVSAPTVGSVSASTSDLYFYGTAQGDRSGISGNPAPRMTWQWERSSDGVSGWSDIAGANARDYPFTLEDVGKFVRVRVNAVNSEGSVAVHSSALGPVGPAPANARIQEIKGAQANIGAAHGIAVDSSGRIYVANAWSDNISVYAADANGDVPPLTVMRPDTGSGNMWGVFVDGDGDVWGARSGGYLVELDPNSNGSVSPKRTLSGPNSSPGGCEARDVAVDGAGYIYTACASQNKVLVFAPDAVADAAPVRSIPTPSPHALAFTAGGNLIVGGNGSIAILEAGPTGSSRPLTRFLGTGHVHGVDVDSLGRIYTMTRGGEVLVWNPAANGQSTPIYRLPRNAATNLADNGSLAIDKVTGKLYIGRVNDQAVNVYDLTGLLPAVPGDSAPTVASVTLGGDLRPAGEIRATLGAITGYPDPLTTIYWQSAASAEGPWTDIPNAVGETYRVETAMAGQFLRAQAVVENSLGQVTAEAAPMGPVGFGPVRTAVTSLRGPLVDIEYAWNVQVLADGRTAVADHYGGGINVYAAGASNNAAPVQQIFSATHTGNPWGLAQGPQGTLFVHFRNGRLQEFASNADGVVTPLRSINTGCDGPGVAVDAAGLIYAACTDGNVRVYAADANGDATPVRIISGAQPRSLAIAPDGNLLVGTTSGIRVYEPGANGSNNPLKSIERGCEFWGVDADTAGRIFGSSRCQGLEIFASDASGSVEPIARVGGDHWTHMGDNTGLSVAPSGLVAVAMSGGHQVVWYDVDLLLEGDPEVPEPVTNVQAVAGSRTFTVTWDASQGEVTHYEVMATGGSAPMVCRTTRTRCVFEWADGVRNDVTYTVMVRTVRRTATADSSNVSVTPEAAENERPPGVPTDVTALGLNGRIVVSWTAPRGTITGYTVTARAGNETLTCSPANPANATECTVEGARVGATYRITVVAQRWEMTGRASEAVEALVTRRDPATVSAFTLEGNPRSGRTLTARGLEIGGFPEPTVTYRWESASEASGPWLPVESSTTPSYDLGRVDVGRFLRLVVVAENGVLEPARRVSNVVGPVLNMAGTTESAARQIVGFKVVPGDRRATVTWEPVKGVTADTYTVQIRGGGSTREVVVRGTEESTVVTGLLNGTKYQFSVLATGHPGSLSREVEQMPIGLLGPVRGVRAVVRGGVLSIAWQRPLGTSPVGTYRVILDGRTPQSRDREVSTDENRLVVRGLPEGTRYQLRIVARNSVGNGRAFVQPRLVIIE